VFKSFVFGDSKVKEDLGLKKEKRGKINFVKVAD
jgi:hypothetical protein